MSKANNANQNSRKTNRRHENGKPSYLRPLLLCGAIAIAGLLVASIWWPNLTERTKFFTANLLNLVIALAVIAQVLVYRKQRDIMEMQWQAIREQSANMERTFVLANRASLSVHSIEMNKARRAVLVKVENTGNMAADHIALLLKLVSFAEVENIESDNPRQESKSSAVREDYGGTRLFKGNLPILLTFYLTKWTENEFRNIEKGKIGLMLIGYVEYGDGFSDESDKRTEFCFDYHAEIDAWSTGPTEYGDMLGWGDEEAG